MKKKFILLVIIAVIIYGSFLSSSLIQESSTISQNQIRIFNRDPLIDFLLTDAAPLKKSFPLFNPGINDVLDYAQYGTFQQVGTPEYRFTIRKRKQLAQDVGAGIIPNVDGVKSDPIYQRLKGQGLLDLSHWQALKLDDHRRAFYIWSQAHESAGVKTYFSAVILEDAGHIIPALKAYYATLVHYPKSFAWGVDKSFVWYCAQAAMDNVHRLLRDHPDLNLSYVDATFDVRNGYDSNVSDDVITVKPGRFIHKTIAEKMLEFPDLNVLDVKQVRGEGSVKLHQFSNGHWMMTVDDKPFYLRGISYNPTTIGIGPQSDKNFMARWMFSDINHNGLNDAAFDAFVDKNKNNIFDDGESPVGDFVLLDRMGVNAIRLYAENRPKDQYDPSLINKELLRAIQAHYGIYVIVGDFLGAYTLGSGASWEEGTDYRDSKQCALMKAAVRAKVLDLKDEPFVLMWVLGNENNMSPDYYGHNATRTNASIYPEVYAKFLNEVAEMIHEIDGNHPVAVGNVELGLVDYYQKHAKAIDILGLNSYRGTKGFGSLFKDARRLFDRPVIITEYGCDAYAEKVGEDQAAQRQFIEGKFRDLVFNQAGGSGEGNVLGGVIFEYLDEWWKDVFSDLEYKQQVDSQFPIDFPDGFSHEEWFGVVGQGNGSYSPFVRQPREAYYYFTDLKKKMKRQKEKVEAEISNSNEF